MADCNHEGQSGQFCGKCGAQLELSQEEKDEIRALAKERIAAKKKAAEDAEKNKGKGSAGGGGGRSFV